MPGRIAFTGHVVRVDPGVLRGSRDEVCLSMCLKCGALVGSTETHILWHENLRNLGEYVETLQQKVPGEEADE